MAENDPICFQPDAEIEDYVVNEQIGNGGFATIFSVRDKRNNKNYAMKIENRTTKRQGLLQEIDIFERLRSTPLFPEYIYSGSNTSYRYLVMELLGPSLSNMRRILPNKKYSPLASIRLGYHMLCCIEELHKQGYVHRDIKPGNFLIKRDPTRTNPIVLTDFGLSKQYLLGQSHIPEQDRQGFVGTYTYASIYAHQGKELSRRDDLISWFYSVIELAESKLPWSGESNNDTNLILLLKRTKRADQLSHNLPAEFASIYSNLMELRFDQKPDYDWIKSVLNSVLRKVPSPQADINLQNLDLSNNEDSNIPYDWEELPEDKISQISPISLKLDDSSEGKSADVISDHSPASQKAATENSCCNIQ